MDYNTYVTTMRDMLVEDPQAQDSNFEYIVPRMIEYAELRIYREFDLLNTYNTGTAVMTSGSRDITIPTGFVVIDNINVISPAGTANPEAGTRIPMERVTLDVLNFTWPSATSTGTPGRYALLNDTSVRVAPTPDGAYTAEFIGTQRPDPLSTDNPNTFISDNLPNIFVAASMIFGAGYLQNFGQASDNPQLAQSWEGQYQNLKAGVSIEELRRKAQSVQWTPYMPTPVANVSRDRS
jgi:hypothetical protein